MSTAIQIRKLAGGRIQARRVDGRPLTDSDRLQAKRLADAGTANTEATAEPARADYFKPELTEGTIIAVLIDSPIVGPVWFALDDGFNSGDAIPVFFASELPFLREMSPAELRRRYEEKLNLHGSWIRETKH